uniref:Disabled homolog 2-interacting protein C-terminal domain-containing protein n=1 Tax=Astyanax mexicanus TaxID=7994 RepID=A0A8B9HWL9_ASTMX
MSFSDKEEQESHLPNGRSISLMDLQGSVRSVPLETPPRVSRVGSQTFIDQAEVAPGVNLPQSAPQVRRPLHSTVIQQCGLQPLSFQNPVYHLSNLHVSQARLAGPLQSDASSENLSTTGSSCSASPGATPRNCMPSTANSVDEAGPGPRGVQGEEVPTVAVSEPNHWPPEAQAVAEARQRCAGTAHIIKVEQQSRGQAAAGNGASWLLKSVSHSTPLHGTASLNTESQQQSSACNRQQSTCSRESPRPSGCPIRQNQNIEHTTQSPQSATAARINFLRAGGERNIVRNQDSHKRFCFFKTRSCPLRQNASF